MKKWDGLVGRMLSGVALIGLVMLSLFAAESSAKTEVYAVNPVSASQSGTANEVWQSAVATCSAIRDTVFLFNGAPRLTWFTLYIQDSSGGGTAGPFSAPPDSVGYRWVKFPVNTPVTRGNTYYFKFSNPSGINYFYAPGTTYGYGRLYLGGSPYPTMDLCCRVTGVNSTDSTYCGMNIYLSCGIDPNDSEKRDSLMSQLKGAGVNLDREQETWWHSQPDTSTRPNHYNWVWTDSAIAATNRRGMKVLFDIFGTPNWASSHPRSDWAKNDTVRWAPPRNLFATYQTGNNYFYNLMCSLATRYHTQGVHDWEIYNEVNANWGYWDSIYYPQYWPITADNRVILYVQACKVAWDAIKTSGIDPSAKIYTNAVYLVNDGDFIHGYEWLGRFYDQGGRNWTDVITYHQYMPWAPAYGHKFYPSKFQVDYDSVRAVLEAKGDRLRPVWADEGGWCTSRATSDFLQVSESKQADVAIQIYSKGIEQYLNPRGPLANMSWYEGYDWYNPDSVNTDTAFCKWAGVWKTVFSGWAPDSGQYYKPSGWAFKQMTGKLKDKYFNRRVPLADTNVYAYEFQEPGSGKRTTVVWRADTLRTSETLAVRTTTADWIKIQYDPAESIFTKYPLPDGSGKIVITYVDSVPHYLKETGTISRPDVIVDSLWLIKVSGTGDPSRAGDSVRFYARIRNISSTALDSTIADSVSFYVDGVRKVKYKAKRGLGAYGTNTDTVTVGFGLLDALPVDWIATWGDHLISAWVDSSDKYVELREDNNQGYIFKHIRPKVSLIINNGAKYSNHLSNNVVTVTINGNTTPNPDSTYFRHESGSWTKIPKTASFDTSVTYSGNGVGYDSVLIFQGADTALAGDSIIVDASAPYTAITSPPDSQTVNLNAQVEFWGFSYDFEYHDSLWQIWENSFAWAEDSTRVGYLGMFWVPGYFGTWTAWSTGWHTHTLVSRDSATNIDTSIVHVYVNNGGGGGNDGFGADFGSFSSAPMNVTTDPNGNLFVAETQNSKVRKYSPKKDSLFAFSARRNDSTGLNWAVGMALKDSTILYVADGYGHSVKAFDRQGNLLLRFGTFGSDTGQFRRPSGIALDWKGRLWIADGLNHRIQVFDTTGKYLFQFGGQGQDSGKFNTPTGIAINKYKLVFVSDTKNNQVQVFDSLGNWKKTIKKPDSLGFDTPTGICTDRHGNVFVADTKNHRIVELNPFGRRLFVFGREGDSLCQFRNPIGVASSPSGHFLYVADMGNKRVQRFYVIRGDTLGGGGPQAGAGVQVLPMVYELGPAIPNPSKGQTTFRYALPKESRVNFTIFNVTGQVVKEFIQGKQKAGYYSITWDGRSNLGHQVGAGVYFYRLQAGNWAKTRKMIVIR